MKNVKYFKILIVYQKYNKEGKAFKEINYNLMKTYFRKKIEESKFLEEKQIKGNKRWARKLISILYYFSEKLKIYIDQKIKENSEHWHDIPSIAQYTEQLNTNNDIPVEVKKDMIETLEKLGYGEIAIYLCTYFNISDKVCDTIIGAIINIHNDIIDIPINEKRRTQKIKEKYAKIQSLYKVAVENEVSFSGYYLILIFLGRN